ELGVGGRKRAAAGLAFASRLSSAVEASLAAEHAATAPGHPDRALQHAPVAAFDAAGLAELTQQAHAAGGQHRAFHTAVVLRFAGDLRRLPDARSAWPTAVVIARRAAELGATAAADPDHTAPDAPVAIAHAGGAAELARLRHLAAGVDAAFLATVVDGLTGNTISVAVTRAARPAAIAAILLEHAATAATDPHPTVAG